MKTGGINFTFRQYYTNFVAMCCILVTCLSFLILTFAIDVVDVIHVVVHVRSLVNHLLVVLPLLFVVVFFVAV